MKATFVILLALMTVAAFVVVSDIAHVCTNSFCRSTLAMFGGSILLFGVPASFCFAAMYLLPHHYRIEWWKFARWVVSPFLGLVMIVTTVLLVVSILFVDTATPIIITGPSALLSYTSPVELVVFGVHLLTLAMTIVVVLGSFFQVVKTYRLYKKTDTSSAL